MAEVHAPVKQPARDFGADIDVPQADRITRALLDADLLNKRALATGIPALSVVIASLLSRHPATITHGSFERRGWVEIPFGHAQPL